uniref:ATP synthase subunit a n=1 Tax=Pimpla luctuosa TaxID=495389 RepID=A0A3Q8U9Z7_9HYME|nr:ATP synthase F0 subunit 6 [Pimpla luctuosa]
MMTNLFSTFDTSTNTILDMNWMSSMLNLLFLPMLYWMLSSRLTLMYKLIFINLYNEFKIILNKKFNFFNLLIYISIFTLIFFSNFIGLFPYIFTSSSHLIFSLSFSLPMWLSLMFFGWLMNTNHMFSHLIPQGTPIFLMPFMVLIETISNLIRPMTLAIRLTANMIAGHLLLTLMSQSASLMNFYLMSLIILTQMLLLTLEFSVAIIQSYVFSILGILYLNETN